MNHLLQPNVIFFFSLRYRFHFTPIIAEFFPFLRRKTYRRTTCFFPAPSAARKCGNPRTLFFLTALGIQAQNIR